MTSNLTPVARVIVVNYNGAGFVERSVGSALAQSAVVEVVVVDNASTDGSSEALAAFEDCHIIHSQWNRGFGAAVNLGARGTTAPFIALLNPDAVADPRWIENLTRWMDEEKIDIASSVVRSEDGYYFGRGLWVWWLGGATHIDAPAASQKTDWVNGCALVMRRNIFERLGGFDENFFLYGEDVDLSLRASAVGARLGIYPRPLALHERHGRSSDQLGLRKFDLAYESRGRLTRKHCLPAALPLALIVQGFVHPLRQTLNTKGALRLTAAYFRGFFGKS